MRGHRHVREWGAAERADSARRGGRAVSGQPQLGAARGKALAADVWLAARRHRCTAGGRGMPQSAGGSSRACDFFSVELSL